MRERRRHERVPFLAKAKITVGPDGLEWFARSVDLSNGGAGLFSPRMIETSTRVEVSFRLHTEDGTVWCRPLRAAVRRCQVDVEGNRLALEFDSLVSDSGDPALLDTLKRALARETRAA